MINSRVILARRPTSLPVQSDFAFDSVPVPSPGPGQVLVRTLYVSIDPGMRGWLLDKPNYAAPVPVGAPMRSFGVGVVTESRSPAIATGDLVVGMTGWQEFAVLDATDVHRRIPPDTSSVSAHLGVLGITGLTAYVGMLEIGSPTPGDTVLVSTAAGAVGSVAGQLASISGARTVGLTGSEEKRRLCLDQFGFDAAINYRAESDLAAAIARECPTGVDVYFDSVGGLMLDAALGQLNVGARVPVCGTIGLPPGGAVDGPRPERTILVKRLRVQGFLATDHLARLDHIAARLADWLDSGRLTHLEEISPSLADAPSALVRQLAGDNLGRCLVRVAPDQPLPRTASARNRFEEAL
jgi:NADPH-dependent curcumin reductase